MQDADKSVYLYITPVACSLSPAGKDPMEKRVIGVLLTLLGIAGLIAAGYFFMQGGNGTFAVKSITLYGILGLVFFLAGVGLVRNTKDKPT